MIEHYRGFKIEVVASNRASGWHATAKITPEIVDIGGLTDIGPVSTGGHQTEEEATSAALSLAKQHIEPHRR